VAGKDRLSKSRYHQCISSVLRKDETLASKQREKLLTDVGDTVLDIFAGSNTTGAAAESLGRKWIVFEVNQTYLATSTFRFLNKLDENIVRILYEKIN
jgi:DNA modification methylase